MTTIESILKHAEQIGKEPGKPQDQRMINNIKIGMRVAISECQRWIQVSEELPNYDFKGYINFKLENHISCKKVDSQIEFIYLCEAYGFTHWRPIDLK